MRVNKLKFSFDKLQNSRCIIRSLSLLRYDANLSKLEVRNLYESINCNFMLFFFPFVLSAFNIFREWDIFPSLSEVAQHVRRTL